MMLLCFLWAQGKKKGVSGYASRLSVEADALDSCFPAYFAALASHASQFTIPERRLSSIFFEDAYVNRPGDGLGLDVELQMRLLARE